MDKGKVAIVTGSSRGIGFEIAKKLASMGVTVVLSSRKKADAEKAAKKIGGNIYPAELDISDPTSVKKFIGNIFSKYKRIDILVNNAGYVFDSKIWYKNFHDVAEEEYNSVFEVDLKGSIRMTRAVISVMLKAKNGGVIISISSTPALVGHSEGAPYTIAKAGLIAMTKHVALEYGVKGIRAYALALGNIATEATYKSMKEDERKKATEETSMKRWGRPDEVANVVASLIGDNFSFATGNTIVVDGGTALL